ncbi:unnamed protein product [Heligmosomoides polygyrus]|uniref:DUF1122 domain-containing protein n=1 Tax=Heligmosomoides polygyrus TaxID=6339 RepID=A0A183F4Y7_HELPZ|nr:unnamed protein product [Heligmosomoides polygyrus]
MAPRNCGSKAKSPALPQSIKADRKRAANLSVMPADYDRRHERYFFVRLTTAIQMLAGVPIERVSPRGLEGWTASLLRECSAVYNGTCGKIIEEHSRGELRGFGTAMSCLTPCGRCTRRPHTVVTHLEDRHGATLVYPALPLLRVPEGPKFADFALEQLILEFPRIRRPVYDTRPETNDEQVRERSRADLDELQEIYRRIEQRCRDPP